MAAAGHGEGAPIVRSRHRRRAGPGSRDTPRGPAAGPCPTCIACWRLLSLLSDALDGLIARAFHLQSAFGARLDNWADTATCWVGLVGLGRFAWPAVRAHGFELGLYALLMALHTAVMVRRFGGIVGLHTWSFKLAAWLQGPAALLLV